VASGESTSAARACRFVVYPNCAYAIPGAYAPRHARTVPETDHGARIDGDASGRSADGLHSMQRKSWGKWIGSIEVIAVDGFSKETKTGSHAIHFALELDLLVVCHRH
jgi:hypothetical protein